MTSREELIKKIENKEKLTKEDEDILRFENLTGKQKKRINKQKNLLIGLGKTEEQKRLLEELTEVQKGFLEELTEEQKKRINKALDMARVIPYTHKTIKRVAIIEDFIELYSKSLEHIDFEQNYKLCNIIMLKLIYDKLGAESK